MRPDTPAPPDPFDFLPSVAQGRLHSTSLRAGFRLRKNDLRIILAALGMTELSEGQACGPIQAMRPGPPDPFDFAQGRQPRAAVPMWTLLPLREGLLATAAACASSYWTSYYSVAASSTQPAERL
jgi:hypothetical protein